MSCTDVMYMNSLLTESMGGGTSDLGGSRQVKNVHHGHKEEPMFFLGAAMTQPVLYLALHHLNMPRITLA